MSDATVDDIPLNDNRWQPIDTPCAVCRGKCKIIWFKDTFGNLNQSRIECVNKRVDKCIPQPRSR